MVHGLNEGHIATYTNIYMSFCQWQILMWSAKKHSPFLPVSAVKSTFTYICYSVCDRPWCDQRGSLTHSCRLQSWDPRLSRTPVISNIGFITVHGLNESHIATYTNTMKLVYNDHLMGYFSVFWSSQPPRWAPEGILLAIVNWYLQSSLKHITKYITGNKFHHRGGRYREVSLYLYLLFCQWQTLMWSAKKHSPFLPVSAVISTFTYIYIFYFVYDRPWCDQRGSLAYSLSASVVRSSTGQNYCHK